MARLSLAGLVAVWCIASPAGSAADRPATERAAGKPNIVLVLTDDLDASSLAHLERIRTLLADKGTSFSQYLVSDALCCPSRATILTGAYNHNHGVLTNFPPDGGFQKFHALGRERSTIAVWLQAAGYRTALMGKYLNGYPSGVDRTYVPAGWDEWASPVHGTPYAGFRYAMNENGSIVKYHGKPADYFTDVLARKGADFITRSAAEGHPFFLFLAPYAPHIPSTPAPRHAKAFAGAKAPRSPSFNEPDVSDKPVWVKRRKRIDPAQRTQIDVLYRKRLQSMRGVEDMIETLLDALSSSGQLGNTFVFFTSDNGYHFGQHRLASGKQSPYEQDLRVPLIVRGPGVREGQVLRPLAGNTDLAATFADIAGASPPKGAIDGRSLLPLLGLRSFPGDRWRTVFLLEHTEKMAGRARAGRTGGGAASLATEPALEPPDAFELEDRPRARGLVIPTFAGLRTLDGVYIEYEDGEKEVYDLGRDPDEMRNLASTLTPAKMKEMSERLAALRACSGGSCRDAEDAPLTLP